MTTCKYPGCSNEGGSYSHTCSDHLLYAEETRRGWHDGSYCATPAPRENAAVLDVLRSYCDPRSRVSSGTTIESTAEERDNLVNLAARATGTGEIAISDLWFSLDDGTQDWFRGRVNNLYARVRSELGWPSCRHSFMSLSEIPYELTLRQLFLAGCLIEAGRALAAQRAGERYQVQSIPRLWR